MLKCSVSPGKRLSGEVCCNMTIGSSTVTGMSVLWEGIAVPNVYPPRTAVMMVEASKIMTEKGRRFFPKSLELLTVSPSYGMLLSYTMLIWYLALTAEQHCSHRRTAVLK